MNMTRVFGGGHGNRSTFKNACERYDLVYFGTVSQHSDEHQMVRGFTLSPSHVDRHYCVGTVSGKDVIILERTDTVSFPDRPSKAYTWLILQIDLARRIPVHVIVNATQYEDVIYKHLFAKFYELREYSADTFADHDNKFTSTFRTFASLQHADDVLHVLQPETTQVLAHHFSQFDYEIIEDQLLVYYPAVHAQDRQIEHIFKAGIWLADTLDAVTLADQTAAAN